MNIFEDWTDKFSRLAAHITATVVDLSAAASLRLCQKVQHQLLRSDTTN
jgi:hypothetical protein